MSDGIYVKIRMEISQHVGLLLVPPQRLRSTRIGQGIPAQGWEWASAENDFSRFGFEPDCAGYTTGEVHETQNQNKQNVITRYGDRQSALTGVRG